MGDQDIELEAFVEILTEYDFDGNPIGCKVEEKWNEFILKNSDEQKKISPNKIKKSSKKNVIKNRASSPSPLTRELGKFSLLQMQQYVIGDLVKKERETNKKLDQIMEKISDKQTEKGKRKEFNFDIEEKQEIDGKRIQ